MPRQPKGGWEIERILGLVAMSRQTRGHPPRPRPIRVEKPAPPPAAPFAPAPISSIAGRTRDSPAAAPAAPNAEGPTMKNDPAFYPSLPLPEMPADPDALAAVVVAGDALAAGIAESMKTLVEKQPHGAAVAQFALLRLVAEHHASMACDIELEGWSPELAARLCRYSLDAAASLAAELAHQKRPGTPWPEQPWPHESEGE